MEERKDNQPWNQRNEQSQGNEQRGDNWQQRSEEVSDRSSQNPQQRTGLQSEERVESSESGLAEGSERSSSESGETESL